LTGNASYDQAQAGIGHKKEKNYQGINGDGRFDRFDKGDGPDYVTMQKMGPMVGLREPEQVLRLNNILNELGLDSASVGSAIAWAMELFQRGIITAKETGGLDLSWGNYQTVETLLFMIANREGFGDVIADSSRAVERGKYPEEALHYRMAVKGLFQSDPHDSRILKAFALGHAWHGPSPQSPHAGNKRQDQRQQRALDVSLRRVHGGRPYQLSGEGIRRPALRKYLRRRRFGWHVPFFHQTVQFSLHRRFGGFRPPACRAYR
jgi:hypothetical protein